MCCLCVVVWSGLVGGVSLFVGVVVWLVLCFCCLSFPSPVRLGGSNGAEVVGWLGLFVWSVGLSWVCCGCCCGVASCFRPLSPDVYLVASEELG